MKYLFIILTLLFPLNSAIAQSVSIGNISKTVICFGDTTWVPYSSSGSFKSDNQFAVQLSDANGSFSTFVNIGYSTALQGTIPVVIGYTADHFRIRMISTDPYTISSTESPEIQVLNYPNPSPSPNPQNIFFGAAGFVGDVIQFKDASYEYPGSTYIWSFDQDASVLNSTVASPSVTFSSEGIKTGHLTVTNGAGCSTTKPFQLRILTCSPVIPHNVHIVTGNEGGSFPFVWVKPGGNYSSSGQSASATVYVEPGSSVRAEFRSIGLYYVKNGSSFIAANEQGSATVVLQDGISISPDYYIDTFHCSNLQFDYSQVGGNDDVPVTPDPLQILSSPNNLRVSCNGEMITASIVDLLGATIISQTDRDVLSLDLSNLNNGVYFAIITSGNRRELRKIAVLH
ncbi:MAG: T9SS type A sorting domain-containing protein [Candidatus Kapaibacterium sp.]